MKTEQVKLKVEGDKSQDKITSSCSTAGDREESKPLHHESNVSPSKLTSTSNQLHLESSPKCKSMGLDQMELDIYGDDIELQESLESLLNSPRNDFLHHEHEATSTKNSHPKLSPGSKPYVLNAVHMEVQENAKIPNTYHIPVRRNTGFRRQKSNDAETNFLDDIMRLNDTDLELTESFLGSDHRMSKAAAYSNAGALMSSIGTKVESMENTLSGQNTDSSVNTTATSVGVGTDAKQISSTNSSNTRVSSNILVPSLEQTSKSDNITQPKANSLNPTHYYGRSVPLPIPTNSNRQTSVKVQIPAKSTTNTIKPPSSSAQNSSMVTPKTTVIQIPKGPAMLVPRTIVSKPAPNRPTYIPNAPGQPNIPLSALHPVKIIAPTAPSIVEATKMRSQFGFGGNHRVPSVPQPPLVKTVIKAPIGVVWKKSTAPIVPGTKNVIQTPSSANTSATQVTAETSSYERKKQRAKDARVKLNESIERLAISINLAGTQSKERIKTQKGWSNISTKALPTETISSNLIKPVVTSGSSNSALSIMEQVSKAADEAKKWDRPSFVGTSAAMIQLLNSECEALMREIVKLKKEKMEMMNSPHGSCTCGKRKKGDPRPHSNSVSDSGSFDEADKIDESNSNPRKRRRMDDTEQETNIFAIFQVGQVTRIISQYLDPRSLGRALSVSTSWRFRLSYFRNDDIWSQLCYARFGSIRVREWQDQLIESQVISKKYHPHDVPTKCKMLQLYKQMNFANARPKCRYEGDLPLGSGRINNLVSGWASLVDRSNGETKRSVMTQDSSGAMKYSSLPVVELRILVQNTGMACGRIFIPEQILSIDASTKRSRGSEMFEVTTDERFKKRLLNIDGTERKEKILNTIGPKNITQLKLYESVLISAFIHVSDCPTMSKVKSKANYVKVLVNIRGTTYPLIMNVT